MTVDCANQDTAMVCSICQGDQPPQGHNARTCPMKPQDGTASAARPQASRLAKAGGATTGGSMAPKQSLVPEWSIMVAPEKPMFVFIDLECTDRNRYVARVIQIAVCCTGEDELYQNTAFGATFSTLVNPEVLIPVPILSLTHLNIDDIRQAPKFVSAWAACVSFIESTAGNRPVVFVAHNAAMFDIPILEFERLDCGLAWPKTAVGVVDTLRICRLPAIHAQIGVIAQTRAVATGAASQGEKASLRLEDLHLTICGTALQGAHNAEADVAALRKVFLHPLLATNWRSNCLSLCSVLGRAAGQRRAWQAQKAADALPAVPLRGHETSDDESSDSDVFADVDSDTDSILDLLVDDEEDDDASCDEDYVDDGTNSRSVRAAKSRRVQAQGDSAGDSDTAASGTTALPARAAVVRAQRRGSTDPNSGGSVAVDPVLHVADGDTASRPAAAQALPRSGDVAGGARTAPVAAAATGPASAGKGTRTARGQKRPAANEDSIEPDDSPWIHQGMAWREAEQFTGPAPGLTAHALPFGWESPADIFMSLWRPFEKRLMVETFRYMRQCKAAALLAKFCRWICARKRAVRAESHGDEQVQYLAVNRFHVRFADRLCTREHLDADGVVHTVDSITAISLQEVRSVIGTLIFAGAHNLQTGYSQAWWSQRVSERIPAIADALFPNGARFRFILRWVV